MKKKSVVIHQPDFMPHLGFFDRFLEADLYISLDHVQFVRNTSRSWTNRDKIKTPQGARWLTVAVKKSSSFSPINSIELADTNWRDENLSLLTEHYKRSSGFKEVMPEIERLYAQPFRLLKDFNIASIELLMDMLDARVPWIWSSRLNPQGEKNDLLVDLLQKVSATHYISGQGALDYFCAEPFVNAQIQVVWPKYEHPLYKQEFGDFIPNLSALDLLLNHGIKSSREIWRTKK